ncbi:MAG: Sec-independent protein translocase TatC [Actinomycetia bacterium]|nr:Sec-independent protein translocase TatC [Actinomycetes bacterium]
MTLVEHLTELRRRVIICVIAVALAAIVAFILYPWIIKFLSEPYRQITKHNRGCAPKGCDLVATDPLQPFAVRLKVATYGGVVLALPVWLWQVWRFVTPGLHKREKRYAIPFILSSILLFCGGGFVAWLTVPKALQFLANVGGSSITPFFTADKYLSLISLMILAFGLSFEFPVLLVFLMLVGVLKPRTLSRNRRWAAVGITTFAAVITPSQDPYSLAFMAVPMYLFYEASILIGKLMKK